MASRGSGGRTDGRGGGGRGGGRGESGGRGGGGGGSGPPKKESILELQKLMDATVRVQCIGGRQMQGTLKGFDDLVNLVLDDCEEFIRDPDTQRVVSEQKTRKLGLVVVRGTQVSLVSPQDGMEEIANPFVAAEEE